MNAHGTTTFLVESCVRHLDDSAAAAIAGRVEAAAAELGGLGVAVV